MLSKRQAKNILVILKPCLKKEKGYYYTLWGKKNKKGLIETIIHAAASDGEYPEE